MLRYFVATFNTLLQAHSDGFCEEPEQDPVMTDPQQLTFARSCHDSSSTADLSKSLS